MADKRIIELTNEKLTLGDGDYTIVDSNEGTFKFKLKRIMDAIPAIDDSLSQEGEAADAKKVGDELTGVKRDLSDKANTDGTYDGMTVGNARQLLSEKYLLDEEPYLFRASGGDGSDRVEECIVGGSVGWNQMCNAASVTVTNGHKYISKVGSTWAVESSTGSAITGLTSGTDMVIDLTTLFGGTIADYIYSLEQATAGAGVAWFRKYFPEDYYPYSAPTLKHVEGVSAKQIRDSDDNVTAIYPLDSSLTLRGVPKLTDGKMWFDGDKYNADGSVQRRYGIVDLGTLDWEKQILSDSVNYNFRTTISDFKAIPDSEIASMVCNKYRTVSAHDITTIGCIKDKTISSRSNIMAGIRVCDSSYTDPADFKAAMSGVMLVYEKATPTTEEATPYTALQTLDPNGTEEFLTTGIVPVGHYSKYLENLRSKIEGLPKDFSTLIAPTEKAYKATRNYTVGSLLIVDNILYKVTSAIANGGTITPNTNVTATTLAAVIAAL